MAPNFSAEGWEAIAPDGTDHLHGLPVDPDIADPVEPTPIGPSTRQIPYLPPAVLVAIFVGGVLGGLTRYGIGRAWPPRSGGFPWDVFAINIFGAFALAMLLGLVKELWPRTRYVRPAVGTGFLGAFTTFSSLAVASDQLLAHGHPVLAIGYIAGSLFGGVAAAALGLLVARILSTMRHRVPTAAGTL
ncbi:MAG TPA: CrcB family protein [Acidothermaceae bacterium]